MSARTILFDLDGTLTDSGEGIIKSSALALRRFHIPVPDYDTMRQFVGPPLHETFIKFGVPDDRADEAVEIYRSRYNTIGKFENSPYPGVYEMLQTLKNRGYRLLVATSKPEELSIEIMEKFKLAGYFDRICGATLDRSRTCKEDVIAYLLNGTPDRENMVMVGDTVFDILGAASHGIPAIGVSWGYGNVEQMKQAGAVAICHTMQELLEKL